MIYFLMNLDRYDHVMDAIMLWGTVAMLLFLAIAIPSRAMLEHFPLNSGLRLASKKKAHGIIFGYALPFIIAHSPADREGHAIVFGGSGSGKTSAVLIPTLRSWYGSGFVVDVSGDIHPNIDRQGKVIFAPMDPSTIHYDVFYEIRRLFDPALIEEALRHLSELLMPLPIHASDSAAFFIKGGRNILCASLMAGYYNYMDFPDICRKVVDSSWQNLFTWIDNSGNNEAISYINSFEGANEKNTAGCKQAVDEAIMAFARNIHIYNALRRPTSSDICLSARSVKDYLMFVHVPEECLTALSPLLHLMVAQILDYIAARPLEEDSQILVALDEFASFGRLDITQALRTSRKRHTRIIVLTQSLADIDLIYGTDERRSMMDNFAFKVVLSVGDSDSQRYFSQLAGTVERTKRSTTSEGGPFAPKRQTVTTERVPTIEPAKLANLGHYLILYHRAGYAWLVKNPYYESAKRSFWRFFRKK